MEQFCPPIRRYVQLDDKLVNHGDGLRLTLYKVVSLLSLADTNP